MSLSMDETEKICDVISSWDGIEYVLVAVEALPTIIKGNISEDKAEERIALAADIITKMTNYRGTKADWVIIGQNSSSILIRLIKNFLLVVQGDKKLVSKANELLDRIIEGKLVRCRRCNNILDYVSIKCPSCGKSIPFVSYRCPHCGRVIGPRRCPFCNAKVKHSGELLLMNKAKLASGILLSILAGIAVFIAGTALGVSTLVNGLMGGCIGAVGLLVSYVIASPLY